MKSNLLLDLFLQQHVPFLYREIRKKALVQYFSPFRSVDMKTMAEAFSCEIAALEMELIDLISSGSIQARIDSDQKILYARTVNQRTKTFADAIEVGRVYQINSKAILLRVAMMKLNLSVRNRDWRGGGMEDGMGGHDMVGMGGGGHGMMGSVLNMLSGR
jgi:COP9 signalosome complex subunit 1